MMPLTTLLLLSLAATAAPHAEKPAADESAVVLPAAADGLRRFEQTEPHMGVKFRIVLYAADQATADLAMAAAYTRVAELNRLLSDYDSASELNRLSAQAPTARPVSVSGDLWRVLSAAQELSRRTDGAFDVTVGPLTKLWRRARRRKELPDAELFAAARQAVGYQKVRLVEKSQGVELTHPEMRLDLGGIAKGYAVDAALATLREQGISRALVDGSGDIGLGDPPPGETGWSIGVAPLEPGGEPSHQLKLHNLAIATSGDAWQHVVIAGTRYSHILDPRTGLGLTDRSSVTILAANCTLADSLASAVSVLGPERGLKLIESTPGAAALIVRAADGQPRTSISRRFQQRIDAQASQETATDRESR